MEPLALKRLNNAYGNSMRKDYRISLSMELKHRYILKYTNRELDTVNEFKWGGAASSFHTDLVLFPLRTFPLQIVDYVEFHSNEISK